MAHQMSERLHKLIEHPPRRHEVNIKEEVEATIPLLSAPEGADGIYIESMCCGLLVLYLFRYLIL